MAIKKRNIVTCILLTLITPAPDTLIRVFMTYKASENYVELSAQELTAPSRTGFTVVEWGGTEITN